MTTKLPYEYLVLAMLIIVFVWALAVDWIMERGFQKRIEKALKRKDSKQKSNDE